MSRRKTVFRSRKGAEEMDIDMNSMPAKRSESSTRDDSIGRSSRQSIATSSDSTDAAADDSDELRGRRDTARVEVNPGLRSKRTRDSVSMGADSSVPRAKKRGKCGETLTNRKRPPERKRVNPRRKVAATLGRGRSVDIVGDCESEEADDEYVASHDSNSSDGGASERRLIGRRKDRRV